MFLTIFDEKQNKNCIDDASNDVNRPPLEPGAHDLQLLVPGQAHAGHFLCVRFWRERGGVGYEGLRERGERVVGVDVGEVLPTEPINVGQLVLVGQAADVVDVSVAEDVGVVACPDAVGPGQFQELVKFDASIKRQQLCHHLSSLLFTSASSCADLGLREVWAKGSMCELGIQTRMAGQERTRWTEEAGRTFGCDGWEEMAQLKDFGVLLYFLWALIDHLMG